MDFVDGLAWLAAGCGVSAAALALGHWFPWRPFIGMDDLPRIWAYMWGVGSILAGVTVWLLGVELGWVLVGLVVLIVVAGMVTLGLYALDDVARARLARKELERESGE